MCNISNTIIGLSSQDIACFADANPVGYQTSDSGYYLNDAEFGVRVLTDCTLTDGWAVFQNARTAAIRAVTDDILARLSDRFQDSFRPFKGAIGEIGFTGINYVGKSYIGVDVSFKGKGVRGLNLIVEGAYFGSDTAGAFPLSVRSNNPDFSPVTGLSVSSAASGFLYTAFPSEVKVPLWTDVPFEDGTGYRFAVTRGSAQPLNSKLFCCGGRPEWRQSFQVYGFDSQSAIFDEKTQGTSTLNQGLVLKARLSCDNLKWLCDIEQIDGYNLMQVVARMVQYRAAIGAYSDMIGRNIINACTLYNREEIEIHRAFLAGKYEDHLTWLIQKLPANVFECMCERSFIDYHIGSL